MAKTKNREVFKLFNFVTLAYSKRYFFSFFMAKLMGGILKYGL